MLPSPRDQHEEKAIEDIKRYGLHIINVLEENEMPNFSYSVGLWHTYQHPEVLIFGLKRELSMWILNEIGRRIKEEKEDFAAGQYYEGFLEGFECTFVEVPKDKYHDHVGWDLWLYGGSDFHLMQFVWPTTEGHFPWDKEASDWFRGWQPVLGGRETY
ncbi:MAG: DUF4262 domain-containing protein [Minwuiales bacterium]|nr:DUF4262 domain-containing protein [Minwuiales bacterium]